MPCGAGVIGSCETPGRQAWVLLTSPLASTKALVPHAESLLRLSLAKPLTLVECGDSSLLLVLPKS